MQDGIEQSQNQENEAQNGQEINREFKPKTKTTRHNPKNKLQKRMEPSSNLTKEYSVEKFKNQMGKAGASGPAPDNNLQQTKQIQHTNQQKIKVLQLRDQLNFYFGDSNLRQDKFLRDKLKENSQLPLSLFLGFNRVKSIVGGGSGSNAEAEKISLLQQAVTKSNILKLSKCR